MLRPREAPEQHRYSGRSKGQDSQELPQFPVISGFVGPNQSPNEASSLASAPSRAAFDGAALVAADLAMRRAAIADSGRTGRGG
jgi:hypothetical protein